MAKKEVLEGSTLENEILFNNEDTKVKFKGAKQSIPITNDLLSKHILFIGAIGTGKTNTMFQLVDQIISNMSDDDVMILFDTKGDFKNEFYRKEKDVIISNDKESTNYWNIMKEALVDGDEHIEDYLMEIANTLFEEKIKNSNAPFFPMAAKDVFYGIMSFLIRRGKDINNETLNDFIVEASIDDVISVFQRHYDLKGIIDYIYGGAESGQSQGVYSELRNMCRELFIGNFKKEGDFSVREFIRKKEGRVLFIEYDMGIGKVLTPIYKVIYDLAIKESLSRKKSLGNVYYIIDEFKLLPNLYHIDNGVNFGRSLGAKFIIAMQNIEQIRHSYGKELAHSVLSGFSTTVSFRATDETTREYVKGLYGKQRRKLVYRSSNYSAGNKEEIIFADVVEDWDISNLKNGEAIISIPNYNPFKFQFSQYKSKTPSS